MKRLFCCMLAVLLLLLAACGTNTQSTQPSAQPSTPAQTPPDPKADYKAFYDYILAQQSAGEIPFEDKLVAAGEVSDAFSLTIGGKPFTNEQAGALTVYTATFEQYTKVEPHTYIWVGYRFTEVCELLSITLGDSIKLHATDGYNQVFDTKNIDENTMLAITKDGEPADGPYFAPCTYLISSSYTKYLSEITIQ